MTAPVLTPVPVPPGDGFDPRSPVVPASVRPGLPFLRGRLRARPARGGLVRRPSPRPPQVRFGLRRSRPGGVSAVRGTATDVSPAVRGEALGYAWGACHGRSTGARPARTLLTRASRRVVR